MHRFAVLTLALALTSASALAQTAPDVKPKPAKTAGKPVAKPAAPREEAMPDTPETIDANQLGIAARVLTGRADCEFNQTVDVAMVDNQPGMFKVSFKGKNYMMVPEETSTGAVRLFNRRTAVVWLQIPSKSMLLDGREGHRLVDACTLAEQRAAVAAAEGAAAQAAAQAASRPAAPASSPAVPASASK